MHLPTEITGARVFITVKTYPRPTLSYEEIVCTAGVSDQGKWLRIYPIPFRDLPYSQQFTKYSWVEMDLTKSSSDARPESYSPKRMFDEPVILKGEVGTSNNWEERKRLVLKEVHTSMNHLIDLAYGTDNKSLATLKPKEIIDLIIEKESEGEWGAKYKKHLDQLKLFEDVTKRKLIQKLPFRYYYTLLTEGDQKPRKLSIFDWEIGALFWKCLQTTGNETEANRLVRQKFLEEFVSKKDIYLFLGTSYLHHKKKSPNPFSVVGVFYPPLTSQLSMRL